MNKRVRCPKCKKYADKRGAYKVGKAVYRIYVHISRQCIVKER